VGEAGSGRKPSQRCARESKLGQAQPLRFVPFRDGNAWNMNISAAHVESDIGGNHSIFGAGISVHPGFREQVVSGRCNRDSHSSVGQQAMVPLAIISGIWQARVIPGPMPIPCGTARSRDIDSGNATATSGAGQTNCWHTRSYSSFHAGTEWKLRASERLGPSGDDNNSPHMDLRRCRRMPRFTGLGVMMKWPADRLTQRAFLRCNRARGVRSSQHRTGRATVERSCRAHEGMRLRLTGGFDISPSLANRFHAQCVDAIWHEFWPTHGLFEDSAEAG